VTTRRVSTTANSAPGSALRSIAQFVDAGERIRPTAAQCARRRSVRAIAAAAQPWLPCRWVMLLKWTSLAVTTRKSLLQWLLTRGLALALVVLVLPYAWAPRYRFPAPAPFSGRAWLNPYAGIGPTWQRANLHAHGRAWSGFTNGKQTNDEIVRRYRELGYDVPGISNYQRISPGGDPAAVPLYEHGYNIGKHHQLAIGARNVTWFDFPLWQSVSQQQFVIDRVKQSAELVALAHPNSRFAYTTEDLGKLTGYDLIEVVNGPFTAEESWDAVLSAGRPVWGVANDDTHDLTDPRRTAAAWNMIAAPTPNAGDVVAALKKGQAYSVSRTGALEAIGLTMLSSVEISGDTLAVTCVGVPSTFTFIGQDGVNRKTVKSALSAQYTLTDADTYVRVVIEAPQTVLYLNPVIRYNGRELSVAAASVDAVTTWTKRGGVLVGCAALTWLAWRRRAPTPGTAAPEMVADAKRKTA
jgi:hypothetical protein